MNEARRTLRCWLLAAFLERGCDPTTARVPEAVPRVRVLEPTELLVLRAGGPDAVHKVRFLSRHRRAVQRRLDAGTWRAAADGS